MIEGMSQYLPQIQVKVFLKRVYSSENNFFKKTQKEATKNESLISQQTGKGGPKNTCLPNITMAEDRTTSEIR